MREASEGRAVRRSGCSADQALESGASRLTADASRSSLAGLWVAVGRLSKVVRGIGPLVVAQAINAAGNFVSLTLTAKHLGPAEYGEYAVFLATAFVVVQVSDGGLSRAITLVCSRLSPANTRRELHRTYATGWAVRASTHLAGLAAFGVIAAIALAAGHPLLAYFASGSLAGLATSLVLFAGGVLQAERRFSSLALLNALPGALRALFVMGLSWSGMLGLNTAAAAYTIAPILAVAVVTPRLGLLDLRSARPSRVHLVRLWNAGRWIALAAALEVFYQRIDVLGLRWLSTPEETGIYAGAFLFISAINFLILAVNAQAYPVLAAAAARRDLAELREVFAASTGILVAVGVPLVCAVATAFPDVSSVVLGGAYARSAAPMQLLAVYGVATVIQFNCGALFLAVGRSSLVALWSLLLVLLEGGGMILAVPRWGAVGAAAVVAAAMVVMLPLSWVWVVHLIGFAIPVRTLAVTAMLVGVALLILAVGLPPRPPLSNLALKLTMWTVVAAAVLVLTARQMQPLMLAAGRR